MILIEHMIFGGHPRYTDDGTIVYDEWDSSCPLCKRECTTTKGAD